MKEYFVIYQYTNPCGDADQEFYVVQADDLDSATELYRDRYGKYHLAQSRFIEIDTDQDINSGIISLGENTISS